MTSNKQRKTIRLTQRQAKWLETLAPDKAHKAYITRRKERDPDAKDSLLDNGNFRRFLRGELGCSRELAGVVCEVYGTTLEQVDAIGNMGPKFRVPEAFRDNAAAVSAATEISSQRFFNQCGEILWNAFPSGGKMPVGDIGNEEIKISTILLDLAGIILEQRPSLNESARKIVFGELLDYLIETDQNDKWGEWMVAVSRKQNRDLFKKIRRHPGNNSLFGCVRDGASGFAETDYDKVELSLLDKKEFDEHAYLVRRINMRINQIRRENYNVLYEAEKILKRDKIRKLREENKVFLRRYFDIALLYIKPFWDAVCETENPHRWNFLLSAARLFNDLATWNYYSVIESDMVRSCLMFRGIRNLAVKCKYDKNAGDVVKCTFDLLAATACRQMAECSAAGIWAGETIDDYVKVMSLRNYKANEVPSDGEHVLPLIYVEDAIHFAKKALDDWNDRKERDESKGECEALSYRFQRNYASILTFAARWWLHHPNRRGKRPDLFSPKDSEKLRGTLIGPVCDEPDKTGLGDDVDGIKLLNKASIFFAKSLCPKSNECEEDGRPAILSGMRQLEYEFHLRVFIEMLVWHYEDERSSAKNQLEDAWFAMSDFCRMILIYAHLFSCDDAGNAREDKRTMLRPATVEAARQWLARNDAFHFDDDNPFDISLLDKTRQSKPPALDETRFEIICSIKYRSSTQGGATASAIWETLGNIGNEATIFCSRPDWLEEFIKEVWHPAKGALEEDLKNSCGIVNAKIGNFESQNPTPELQRENYKEYPPFAMRFDLLAAPGNNPRRVDSFMRCCGLIWDKVGKAPKVVEPRPPSVNGEWNDSLSLKTISRGIREDFVDSMFGKYLERNDVADILFPAAKSKNAANSALTQFLNDGKGAEVIQQTMKTILSVDSMAGVANLLDFKEDKSGENEFKRDLRIFLNNAKVHTVKHSVNFDYEKIKNALSAITAISSKLPQGRIDSNGKEIVRALWNGIVAYVGSCKRLTITFLSEIEESMGEAMSASQNYCAEEIESLKTVFVPQTAFLWQYAVRNQRNALESFKIYASIIGKDTFNKDAAIDFCSSFGGKKRETNTPHYPALKELNQE